MGNKIQPEKRVEEIKDKKQIKEELKQLRKELKDKADKKK